MSQATSPSSSSYKCASCGNTDFSLAFEANDFDTGKEKFTLKKCTLCKLVHTDPLLGDSELSKYYKTEYYGKGTQKFSHLIEKWTIYSNLKLAKSIMRSFKNKKNVEDRQPRILDIGCGRGNLLKAFNQMDFECHGIERTEFPDQNRNSPVTIHRTSLREVGFGENYFDIIVLWHVLEHLSDPGDIVKEIYKVLNPSGILVIAVPNFGSYQSRIFGKHWFHLDIPRHLYHYDTASLESLLQRNQFQIDNLDTRSIDQSVFGFVQSALNTLPWFSPNSFYEQLKLPWRQRKLSFYPQLFLGMLLSPFALIDYVVSASTKNGSCLVVTARKQR